MLLPKLTVKLCSYFLQTHFVLNSDKPEVQYIYI